ncbi:hypothetical protein M0P98_06215 [bacterium]|nr:hypothetical protein [bacterium]
MNKKKSSFLEVFSNLNGDFGPVPWWCWTGRMTKKEMLYQLKDMKQKGINEFFIMALYGLEYPSFLQESYWEYAGFVLKKCEEMGMKVWFYDDLNWPSGTAAGYFLKERQEYRGYSMELKEVQVEDRETVNIESMVQDNSEILFVGIKDVEGDIRKVSVEKKLWWKNPQERRWINKTGKPVVLMVLVKKLFDKVLLSSTGTADSWQQRGYGDMLNKEAVETWMSYIYKEYLKRFKNYFGSTLRGFFFDEPYANINKDVSFAYTEKLFPEFEKRYGYRLQDNFHLLLSEDNLPETIKMRIDYYSLITSLFSNNFAKTVADWCGKHNVFVTGHCMAEESISFSNKVNGDIHEFLKHLQVPGMDMLAGCMPGRPLQIDIWKRPYDYPLLALTAKRTSSTGRYSGAKRTMCEAFGVRDWNSTLAEQKKDNDWLASMGLNLINDNALIYSISDFRKRAIAGKHFSQPWWKYYKFYADYCRRVSLFASWAPLDTDIALLYSATTAFAGTTFRLRVECNFWKETLETEEMLDMLLLSINSLFDHHIDFEMIFEDIIKESTIVNGVLKCKNGEFKTIVVPGCYVLDSDCLDKLKEFSKAGGNLIWLGRVPEWLYKDGKVVRYQHNKVGKLISKEGETEDEFKTMLVDSILSYATKSWRVVNKQETEGLWITARKTEEEYLIFLANHTGKSREVVLEYNIEGKVVIMDVDDGNIYKVTPYKINQAERVNLMLMDGKSIILNIGNFCLTNDRKPVVNQLFSGISSEKVLLNKKWEFVLEGENHYLPELFVKTDPLLVGEKEEWYKKTIDSTWQKVFHGKLEVAFTSEESPFYWVRGKFDLKFLPSHLSFIVDTKEWEKLFVNGQEVIKPEKHLLWDKENMVFKVKDFYKEGENEFVFLVRSSYWRSWKRELPGVNQKGSIEPMVISGDFKVEEKGGRVTLAPIVTEMGNKGWNDFGYPYFAGTGVYRQTIKLKSVPQSCLLVIESAFTAVEVIINNSKVGARVWQPYVFDIGGFLNEGNNEIVIKVTNSLGNILKCMYSGTLGIEQKGGITGEVYLLCFY